MAHFDPCEACGRNDLIVIEGLCHECNRKADRAAGSKAVLPRTAGLIGDHSGIRMTLVASGRHADRYEGD